MQTDQREGGNRSDRGGRQVTGRRRGGQREEAGKADNQGPYILLQRLSL